MDGIQITALILFICGLALAVACVIKMYLIKKFKQQAVITKAVITKVENRRAYKGGVYYILTLQYNIIETGNLFTGATTISGKKHIPGDTIPLMYSANNPAKYKTDFGNGLPWVLGFSIIFWGLITWFCYWLLHTGYYKTPSIH